jgi:hypothetical protein
MLPSSVILQSDSQSVHLGFVLDGKCCGATVICGVALWSFPVKLEKCIFEMICWIVLIMISSLLKLLVACCEGTHALARVLVLRSPLLQLFAFSFLSLTFDTQINARTLGYGYSFCRFHSYVEDCGSITPGWNLCNIFCWGHCPIALC